MKDYYDKVKRLLIEDPLTRDDDMYLYGLFCARYTDIGPDISFYWVMSHAKMWKIPSYEGVSRARRKVQELEPYLCGNRKKARRREEAEYHRYYSEH